jgi:hypothetical protein
VEDEMDKSDNVNNHYSNRLSVKEKIKDKENSKSNEKIFRPPKDKKMASSGIPSNNNELMHSKDLKRDSNYNKYRKRFAEKSKL